MIFFLRLVFFQVLIDLIHFRCHPVNSSSTDPRASFKSSSVWALSTLAITRLLLSLQRRYHGDLHSPEIVTRLAATAVPPPLPPQSKAYSPTVPGTGGKFKQDPQLARLRSMTDGKSHTRTHRPGRSLSISAASNIFRSRSRSNDEPGFGSGAPLREGTQSRLSSATTHPTAGDAAPISSPVTILSGVQHMFSRAFGRGGLLRGAGGASDDGGAIGDASDVKQWYSYPNTDEGMRPVSSSAAMNGAPPYYYDMQQLGLWNDTQGPTAQGQRTTMTSERHATGPILPESQDSFPTSPTATHRRSRSAVVGWNRLPSNSPDSNQPQTVVFPPSYPPSSFQRPHPPLNQRRLSFSGGSTGHTSELERGGNHDHNMNAATMAGVPFSSAVAAQRYQQSVQPSSVAPRLPHPLEGLETDSEQVHMTANDSHLLALQDPLYAYYHAQARVQHRASHPLPTLPSPPPPPPFSLASDIKDERPLDDAKSESKPAPQDLSVGSPLALPAPSHPFLHTNHDRNGTGSSSSLNLADVLVMRPLESIERSHQENDTLSSLSAPPPSTGPTSSTRRQSKPLPTLPLRILPSSPSPYSHS